MHFSWRCSQTPGNHQKPFLKSSKFYIEGVWDSKINTVTCFLSPPSPCGELVVNYMRDERHACSRIVRIDSLWAVALPWVSVLLVLEFLWCGLLNKQSLFPKSLCNNTEKCKRTVGFLRWLDGCHRALSLKTLQNLLILNPPLPPPHSPLTSPRHPDLDPNPLPLILTSLVLLTNAPRWYWSAARRWEVMDVHIAAKKPACITLMLSNQALRWVLSSTHEGAPCLKRLLKPDSSDCGEPHP